MNKKLVHIVVGIMLLFATVMSVAVIGNNEKLEKSSSSILTDEPWPMFQQNAGHTGYSSEIAPDKGNVLWNNFFGGGQSAIAADEKVYISTNYGLFCLYNYNGSICWDDYRLGMSQKTPAILGGNIYAVNMTHVVAVNLTDGNVEWNQYVGATSGLGSVVAANDKVYATADTVITCVDAADGNVIWTNSTGTVDSIFTDPAVDNGKVYVAVEKQVFCFDGDTGELDWQQTVLLAGPTEVFYFGAVTAADGKIYVVSLAGTLYCLDGSDGSESWNYSSGSFALDKSPAIAYGNAYIGLGNMVVCLDVSDGSEVWTYTTGASIQSSPAVADSKVYIADAQKLYCLDAVGGGGTTTLIWEYSSTGIGTPSVAYGLLYVPIGSFLYAFTENEAPEIPSIEAPRWNNKNDAIPFTVNTTDADGDEVFYIFRWGGGTGISQPFGPYPSGEEVVIYHTYPANITENKTYNVKVKGRDVNQQESDWSEPIPVSVNNTPPGKPVVSGPSIGKPGIPITFEFSITDNENDILQIKWIGDVSTGWHGDYDPGTYTEDLVFDNPGTYEFQLKSREKYGNLGLIYPKHGYESDSSDSVIIEIIESALEIGDIAGSGKFLKGATISTELIAGEVPEQNVEWSITVKGGIFGLINVTTIGTIETIGAQEAVTIETDTPIIGLGPIDINISAVSDGMVEPVFKSAKGNIFFFWPLNIKEN